MTFMNTYKAFFSLRLHFDIAHQNYNADMGVRTPKNISTNQRSCVELMAKKYESQKDLRIDYISTILMIPDTYLHVCTLVKDKNLVEKSRNEFFKILQSYHYWFRGTLNSQRERIHKAVVSGSYLDVMYDPEIHILIFVGLDMVRPLDCVDDIINAQFIHKVRQAKWFLALNRSRIESDVREIYPEYFVE